MRKATLLWLERLALIAVLLALGGSLWLVWAGGRWGQGVRRLVQPVLFARPAPDMAGQRVGLVAGHSGYDSGAVCPDGLREVDVNLAVTQRVAEYLRRAGIHADILTEFDDRLVNYRADAFVSIHSDSCVDASGFKAAHAVSTVIPEIENRLVTCLYKRYEEITGLPRHEGSITHNMTQYHAFRVIDPRTPAAIIELGFLGGDRTLLTSEQDRVARGVAEGILCFLANDAADSGTPAPRTTETTTRESSPADQGRE